MILITGATGSIGTRLVRRLQELDVPFRAMARDEAKGRELGCDVVTGDFDDPDSVAAALVGVDRLFLNGAGAVPTAGPRQPMVAQQITAIDLAVAAGVQAIVKVSVWGARQGAKLAAGAHWEIEQHLAAAPVASAVLQPGGFMQNFLTGAGAFSENGDLLGIAGGARVSYIDCYDIAACAAVLLTGAQPARGTFVLTGPEALTQAEIAARLSAAFGRPVGSLELPPHEMTARLVAQGVPASFAADVAELWDEIADGSLAAVTPTVRELTGADPRTFERFLADLDLGADLGVH
ncbi:NmrA family NAD(P)-binding protein [Frankia sp. AgB1.9]|uniref:NmrA family NAD(P)-binding protein n=1 Tax=unclassified Frankia TaxID=2632575 RepID=UPI001931A07A|nr:MULTISPECIES: NmrA family NAD(P)-binding protein [unclassified Frankia]MBL7491034.1 NmrA family NAD(P)-binding protein [Frankia sp. AgW1.1]MBL7549618.1 NmrA family NAD(P)-binding protein [Frankia sp. AgB1.9]MBL7620401.1 NmrA family NAD(P)-binding protein [Frankia sp. AgB1.8]